MVFQFGPFPEKCNDKSFGKKSTNFSFLPIFGHFPTVTIFWKKSLLSWKNGYKKKYLFIYVFFFVIDQFMTIIFDDKNLARSNENIGEGQ